MKEFRMAKEYVLVDRAEYERSFRAPRPDGAAVGGSVNPFQNPDVRVAKSKRRALGEIVADTRLTAEQANELFAATVDAYRDRVYKGMGGKRKATGSADVAPRQRAPKVKREGSPPPAVNPDSPPVGTPTVSAPAAREPAESPERVRVRRPEEARVVLEHLPSVEPPTNARRVANKPYGPASRLRLNRELGGGYMNNEDFERAAKLMNDLAAKGFIEENGAVPSLYDADAPRMSQKVYREVIRDLATQTATSSKRSAGQRARVLDYWRKGGVEVDVPDRVLKALTPTKKGRPKSKK